MKARLRREIRRTLAEMPADVAAAKSRSACDKLTALDAFRSAASVMVYLHIPDEVDTTRIVRAAWDAGKRVLVPSVSWTQREMAAVVLHSLAEEDLARDRYGVRTPAGGVEYPPAEIDFIAVPALAYDRIGNRLGRGAGFYDRFLSRPGVHAVTCGLAFAEQVVDSVPVRANDWPVRMLVTDTEVLEFHPRAAPLPAADPTENEV